jgi:hypothetical protein
VPGALVTPKVTVEPFTSNIDGASFGYGDREQIRSPFPGRLVASPAGTLRSFNLKSKAGSVTAFASTRRAHGLRYSAVLSRRSCACTPAQFGAVELLYSLRSPSTLLSSAQTISIRTTMSAWETC